MEPPSPASVTTTPETGDWAALPHDILLTIFLRLGPCEIMQGAELVCTTWRRVAVDEPALWRRVDMGTASFRSTAVERAAARAAVTRGAGQCEAFSGRGDNGLLLYLVERAPSLKSLHLSSYDGPSEILSVALKKLTFLEDLEISQSRADTTIGNLFETVCEACPLLRTLTMKFYNSVTVEAEIPTMSELRSLKLGNYYLTATELMTILDFCPLLEYLHITGSFVDEMDAELTAKCARVKNLTLPVKCTEDDYDLRGYDDWYCLQDFEEGYEQNYSWDYGFREDFPGYYWQDTDW